MDLLDTSPKKGSIHQQIFNPPYTHTHTHTHTHTPKRSNITQTQHSPTGSSSSASHSRPHPHLLIPTCPLHHHHRLGSHSHTHLTTSIPTPPPQPLSKHEDEIWHQHKRRSNEPEGGVRPRARQALDHCLNPRVIISTPLHQGGESRDGTGDILWTMTRGKKPAMARRVHAAAVRADKVAGGVA